MEQQSDSTALGRTDTRSGYIAIAGRPNVGKSTLVNQLVGEKVTIVSDKPQTTRRALRGVLTGSDWQLVLVDLPGVQRPIDRLTSRMQGSVENELGDCDGVLFVLNAKQGVGPGDRFIMKRLAESNVPVTIALNQTDRVNGAEVLLGLQSAFDLGLNAEIFPISALTGDGVEQLKQHLVKQLPPGPFYFEADAHSDLTESEWIAEVVREKVLHRTRQELPHAVGAEVVDFEVRESGVLFFTVDLIVERKSQRAILVGHNGQMVKAIGTAARVELEEQLDRKLFLYLRVKVEPNWRASDRRLDSFGL